MAATLGLDRRRACFVKLSMRIFVMPYTIFLSLSLSKAAPVGVQRHMR